MLNKKEYAKQYYIDNREKILKCSRQWAKDNPEAIIKQHKEYYDKYRGKYRLVVEKKIGRKLTNEERVHHIDMDKTNNDPENLYVYNNGSTHLKEHGNLNKLIAELLNRDILGFKDGEYYLKGL